MDSLRKTEGVIDLETAINRILAALPAPQDEAVELVAAAERVLAENLVATVDLPPFDGSVRPTCDHQTSH